MKNILKVILADDHAILRQGLRSLLAAYESVEIIAEANDGREAITLAEEMDPDLLIMDIAMPGLNGLEATRQIRKRFPEIKVLILSMHAEDIYVIQALLAGANAYVHKKAVFQELMLALEAVQKNECYLSPAVSKVLVNQITSSPQIMQSFTAFEKLTQREREVLQLLLEDCSRKEMARILSISPKTIDKHQENIKMKLNIDDETDLLKFARIIGIMT